MQILSRTWQAALHSFQEEMAVMVGMEETEHKEYRGHLVPLDQNQALLLGELSI